MDDRTTTTEEATQLFHKAGDIAGWKPGVGNPLVINYLRIFADLVRAEENEACAKVVINVANEDAGNPYKQALRIGAEAIRARREPMGNQSASSDLQHVYE